MTPDEVVALAKRELGAECIRERERCARIADMAADAAETHEAKLMAKHIAETIRLRVI